MMSGRLDSPRRSPRVFHCGVAAGSSAKPTPVSIKRLQRHRHLHACNAGPGAEMRPGAESQVLVRPAVETHFIGLLEHGWVAVCRAEAERDDVARPHLPPMQRDVVRGVSPKDLDRRGMAQEFLDRSRDHGRIRCKPRQRLGMFGKPAEHDGQPVGRRLEAGAEHHRHERAYLVVVQPLAVDFGRDQRAEEIAGRRRAALGDQRLDIGDELAARRCAGDRVADVEHLGDPADPALGIGDRNIGEGGKRGDRDRHAEFGDCLGCAPFRHGVDDRARERLDARRDLRHALRREDRVDQRAVARMTRRVDLDRQHRLGARCDDRDRRDAGNAGRVVAPVDGGGAHVLVAAHQPEAAMLVRAGQRAFAAQPFISRERVAHESRVVDVHVVGSSSAGWSAQQRASVTNLDGFAGRPPAAGSSPPEAIARRLVSASLGRRVPT